MLNKALLSALGFAIALLVGCAQQPSAPTSSESEQLAAEFPDAEQLAIPAATEPQGPRVVATGNDQPRHDVLPDVYADRDATTVEVLRGGRYALVTTRPTLEQRDLLEQTVNISIPSSINPTVEDAMRHTLQHTGFSLCNPQGRPQQLLYTRPLPAAHYRLGPMPLREALQVLGGPAFEVQADPIARNICYQVRDQRLVGG